MKDDELKSYIDSQPEVLSEFKSRLAFFEREEEQSKHGTVSGGFGIPYSKTLLHNMEPFAKKRFIPAKPGFSKPNPYLTLQAARDRDVDSAGAEDKKYDENKYDLEEFK